jgi:hypothetical protein
MLKIWSLRKGEKEDIVGVEFKLVELKISVLTTQKIKVHLHYED